MQAAEKQAAQLVEELEAVRQQAAQAAALAAEQHSMEVQKLNHVQSVMQVSIR